MDWGNSREIKQKKADENERKNRNLPTEFARQLSIEWLFQLPKLTYAQDQTVQLGMEKTLQNLPDTFSRCGKGQTNIFSFFNSLLLNLFHVFLINRSQEKIQLHTLFFSNFQQPIHCLSQTKTTQIKCYQYDTSFWLCVYYSF